MSVNDFIIKCQLFMIIKIKRRIESLVISFFNFILRILNKLAKLVRMDLNELYINYLFSSSIYNSHLFSKKIQNNYISHLPDRYSINLQLYNAQINFFEHKDLNNWIEGNYINNIGDISRFFFLNLCIDYLLEENIHGNVAELGVYKGNSAFLLAKYAERVNSKCYLFDTFEGFDKRDLVNLDLNVKKTAFDDTSLDYVKKIVNHDKYVVFVKGYFPESLNQVKLENDFSLVHIDCDLEKPFIDSLNYFYPKIKKGGFLIMHDHSSLHWLGGKQAIDNFFSDKPESIIPIPDKSGTCVIRKV